MNILIVQLTPEQRDLSCMGAPYTEFFQQITDAVLRGPWLVESTDVKSRTRGLIVFSCVGCWRSQTLCCSRSTVIPSSVTFSVTT